ncbi:MAG: hypothetical protein KF757_11650 [Phycisphaeraceae bacterium]|nr:hypothetical protein [Phycisphaeraceae bacterium]MCW5762342.1 hypothetical protein [Phycisphaeraceae bacterium]
MMRWLALAATLGTTIASPGCASLRPATPLPTSTLTTTQSPWTYQGRPGVAISTPRVQLFTTLPPGLLRDRLPIVLEHTISSFDRLYITPPVLTHRVEVVVFHDVALWRTALSQRFGVSYALDLDRGAATSRGVSLLHDVGTADTLRLAAHEVWHAHAQLVLRRQLPTAIDEAIACWAEGISWDESIALPVRRARDNPARKHHLRNLLQSDHLGSLHDHLAQQPERLTSSPAAMDAYYTRAWVLGLLLIESGDAHLHNSLATLIAESHKHQPPSGQPPTPITSSLWWETNFGRSLTEIDNLWQQFAALLAFTP